MAMKKKRKILEINAREVFFLILITLKKYA